MYPLEDGMNREAKLIAAKKCLDLARDLIAEDEGVEDAEDQAFTQRVRGLKTKLNKLGQKKRRKLTQFGIGTIRPNSTVEDLVGALEQVLAES